MKPNSQALLEKAGENIAAVETLISEGLYAIAAGRAYYAMFYCAEAVLAEHDMKFSSHGEVHSAFGREFIKSGKLGTDLHRYLLDAFRERQEADYQAPAKISEASARQLLEQAKIFNSAIVDYLLPG